MLFRGGGMNIKMGLKRTAIVFAIFWVVGWSFVAWKGNQEIDSAMTEIAKLDKENEQFNKQHPEGFAHPFYSDRHIYWGQMSTRGSDKVWYAITIGLFGPIALLLLSPFGWFIYRGFKPKLPPQSD